MSYEFVKLSEVEEINNADNASLIVEQNGEIKRLSTDNINFGGGASEAVQADWEEDDPLSMAYIRNKPSLTDLGSNWVLSYDAYSGTVLDMVISSPINVTTFMEKWDSGTNIVVYDTDGTYSKVLAAHPYMLYGYSYVDFLFYSPSQQNFTKLTING